MFLCKPGVFDRDTLAIREMVENKLKQVNAKLEMKIEVFDDTLRAVQYKQENIEIMVKSIQNRNRKVIEDTFTDVKEYLSELSDKTIEYFEAEFEVRENAFQSEIKSHLLRLRILYRRRKTYWKISNKFMN